MSIDNGIRRFRMAGLVAIVLAGTAGCSDPNSLGNGEVDPGARVDPPGPGAPGSAPVCVDKPNGRAYVGYGQEKLEADRLNEASVANRSRVKPYSVLAAEYVRAIGEAPPSLGKLESTFGNSPPRWFDEPLASAVIVSSGYDVAFEGCVKYTGAAPEFAAAPTAESAGAQCAAMMRKFWSRTPDPTETSACVTFATGPAAKEAAPRRRWAYVCASVLTSTRFLTY